MKTYIRKNIKGYYINFPEEIDALYWAGKIGSTYLDFLDGKWILLSDEQVAFHTEYPSVSISNMLAMLIPLTYVRTLEDAKREKILLIEEYDLSEVVNSFNVTQNGLVIATSWLTPAERANYRSSIDAAELVGLTELSLYIGELPITLPVANAKMMLAQILLYADLCFIVTKLHKAIVDTFLTIESVDSYNITNDYPAKLSFSIG